MRSRQSTEVTIRLSRERVIYNLANNAYVVGDILTPGHCQHQVQDMVEGQNLDLVDMVLWRSYCRVRRLLEPYLDEDCGTAAVCGKKDDGTADCLEGDGRNDEAAKKTWRRGEAGRGEVATSMGDFVLYLLVPGAVSKAMVDYWAILAYEYITATAMEEWLEMVSPEQVKPWQKKSSEACRQLKESMHLIHRHVRKRMEKV